MAGRCKKLTKEQRKAVWAGPESNAGAGWAAKGGTTKPRETDPLYDDNGELKELDFD